MEIFLLFFFNCFFGNSDKINDEELCYKAIYQKNAAIFIEYSICDKILIKDKYFGFIIDDSVYYNELLQSDTFYQLTANLSSNNFEILPLQHESIFLDSSSIKFSIYKSVLKGYDFNSFNETPDTINSRIDFALDSIEIENNDTLLSGRFIYYEDAIGDHTFGHRKITRGNFIVQDSGYCEINPKLGFLVVKNISLFDFRLTTAYKLVKFDPDFFLKLNEVFPFEKCTIELFH